MMQKSEENLRAAALYQFFRKILIVHELVLTYGVCPCLSQVVMCAPYVKPRNGICIINCFHFKQGRVSMDGGATTPAPGAPPTGWTERQTDPGVYFGEHAVPLPGRGPGGSRAGISAAEEVPVRHKNIKLPGGHSAFPVVLLRVDRVAVGFRGVFARSRG